MNLIASCLLFAASVAASATEPKLGRLVGHVDIGPISPVERPGVKVKVPPEMYKHYTVLVTQPGPHNGQMKSMMIRLVARLKLDSNGDFSTNLRPGEYNLKVEPTNKITRSDAKTVMIKAGQTTRVTLSVDTGIR